MSTKNSSNALQVTQKLEIDRNEHKLVALKELNLVLKANPESFIAYKLRGTINLELGLKKEALADLTLATQLNMEDDSAFNLLGISLLALGQKMEALESFSRSIELNPKNQQAFFNRGRARYSLEMKQEAIADFKQAIILDTADNKNKSNKTSQNSGIFYQMGLVKKALVDLQETDRKNLEHRKMVLTK